MKSKMKQISILAVLAVFGLSAFAFAGWGVGSGHMMGSGWHRGWDNDRDLSSEQVAELQRQRAEFFKATEDVRQELNAKALALESELAQKDPDIGRAKALQKDISKLRADLDQKRLEYDIQAGKSARDWGHGPMMGYGYGAEMGYGHHGRGYCSW